MDETSTDALAALETARTKLSEAYDAYRRAEQKAFDNDDFALAFQSEGKAREVEELIERHDAAFAAQV
jgi:hypothetical protein